MSQQEIINDTGINFQQLDQQQQQTSRQQIESRLISIAYQNQTQMLRSLIDESETLIDLLQIRDRRQFSLLHIACLNNQVEMVQFLLNFHEDLDPQKILEWINSKTDEGFNALHFASFRGNIEIIKLLEDHMGDIFCVNNQGLSLLHIAAQGDQPVSLVHFRERGLDINQLDQKGSSPLHWACYLGSEHAVNYLVNWVSNLDRRDKGDGFTALHLAVLSGSSKVVRKLLIKGCDKDLRDNHGKTPFDLAKDSSFHNIQNMMAPQSCLTRVFNIRPAFKPMQKKKRSLLAFSVFYLVGYLINLLFVLPFVKQSVWVICDLVSVVIVMILFLLSVARNPGYLQTSARKTPDQLISLLLRHSLNEVCADCELVKPKRSKHCEFCRQCVSVYDHHCPWINNCVGANNHNTFLLFLFSVYCNLFFQIVFLAYHVSRHIVYNQLLCPSQVLNFINTHPHYYLVKIISSALLMLICLLFIFPLTYLLIVQCKNFVSNMTTFERYGFQQQVGQANNLQSSELDPNGSVNPSVLLDSQEEQTQQFVESTKSAVTDVYDPRYSNNSVLQNCLNMCYYNKRNSIFQYKNTSPI